MDSVRFGRALGMGARGAAKALAMAAEAAVAEKSSAAANPSTPPAAASQGSIRASAARTATQLHHTRSGLAQGGKRFGEAVWGPFVKLSGVLWLELTGVFFGLFLLTALMSTWRLRGNLHDTVANHADHQRLLWSVAMSIVFGYFCISSFVRAARRERGKK